MAVEIISGLYLGNKMNSHNLEFLTSRKIGVIINTTEEVPFFNECKNIGIQCIRVPISDCVSQTEKANNEFYYQFSDLCKLIDNKLKKNINILIHCRYGKYRSTALVIAYLMYKTNLPFKKLYDLLKTKYPLVKRKKHIFLEALKRWEEDKKNI